MEYPKLRILPAVGEACARAAYEANVKANDPDGVHGLSPWEGLQRKDRDRWESVAMAAVTEYATQLTANEVTDRWREAAIRDLLRDGG